MPFSRPQTLLRPLAARLPAAAAPVLAGLALAAWLAASAAIARGQGWAAATLGLAGLVLDAVAQARGGEGRLPPLALFLPAFAFALHDPSRSLAAMFLVVALAIWVSQQPSGSSVGNAKIGVGAAYIAAFLLPDYFSLLAYLVGVTCFVLAGQGVVRR